MNETNNEYPKEDEIESARLQKEIAKRQNFLDKVDDRECDPDFTKEQFDEEYKKYCRYEKEIVELRAKQSKLKVWRFP